MLGGVMNVSVMNVSVMNVSVMNSGGTNSSVTNSGAMNGGRARRRLCCLTGQRRKGVGTRPVHRRCAPRTPQETPDPG
ncbi:hypothetical protein GCM10018781_64120 [Kitasatospora indigofera]|uniref:Uncharacterized protein n=1 Tax=Kitasatospora indigofera TaxID=67307 RepID=A0A919GAX3_9ACTN|nr:hypothetical protein GCM10018781_64120 [Kitasatospora indigofera]